MRPQVGVGCLIEHRRGLAGWRVDGTSLLRAVRAGHRADTDNGCFTIVGD